MSDFKNPIIFDQYNAKHLAAKQIAQTFVPPFGIFHDLVNVGNTLISGPRGSGKTTLLKMLTLPALHSWEHEEAKAIRSKIPFIGVFIPADRTWHGQLESTKNYLPNPQHAELIGKTAFITHICMAIVDTFKNINRLDFSNVSERLDVLTPSLSHIQEKELCEFLEKHWELTIDLPTFSKVENALEVRMKELGKLRSRLEFLPVKERDKFLLDQSFLHFDTRSTLIGAIRRHNKISKLSSRKWCFLFDEIEIAPTVIQKSIFGDLRGTGRDAEIITNKVSLAPYNRNFIDSFSENSPTTINDYKVIDLTYSHKMEGVQFTRSMLTEMIHAVSPHDTIESFLGKSRNFFPESDDSELVYEKGSPMMKAIQELAKKDLSFREYLGIANLNLDDLYSEGETTLASKIRKVRSIILSRNSNTKLNENNQFTNEKATSRSKKTYAFYCGSPTILELVEGNPRWIKALFLPIIRELEFIRMSNSRKTVVARKQATFLKNHIHVYRTFLKNIAYDDVLDNRRGLLYLLDRIGTHFYNGVSVGKFNADPKLTFRVDAKASDNVVNALGRALNVGAIIYVYDDKSTSSISSIRGKKFRLNYLLAAYYKLPIILGKEEALTSILGKASQQETLKIGPK